MVILGCITYPMVILACMGICLDRIAYQRGCVHQIYRVWYRSVTGSNSGTVIKRFQKRHPIQLIPSWFVCIHTRVKRKKHRRLPPCSVSARVLTKCKTIPPGNTLVLSHDVACLSAPTVQRKNVIWRRHLSLLKSSLNHTCRRLHKMYIYQDVQCQLGDDHLSLLKLLYIRICY